MLHIIFTDEAKDNSGLPGPWYCRVGVVVRPEAANGIAIPLGDRVLLGEKLEQIRSIMRPLRLLEEKQFHGQKLLRRAAMDPKVHAIATELCELVGPYVDILVVESRTDQVLPHMLPAASMLDREDAVETEVAGRFLLACYAWLEGTSRRHGGRHFGATVCFDNITTSPTIRAAMWGYEDVLRQPLNARHWLGRSTYVPSHYELQIQLADVYAAFIRAGNVGGGMHFRNLLRQRFEITWVDPAERTRLWVRV